MCLGSKTLLSNVSCSGAAVLSGQKFTGICWRILFLLNFLWLVLSYHGSWCSWVVCVAVCLSDANRAATRTVQQVWYWKQFCPKDNIFFFFFALIFPMTWTKAQGKCCPCAFISPTVLIIVSRKELSFQSRFVLQKPRMLSFTIPSQV